MKTIYDDKIIFRKTFKDAQEYYWNSEHPICKMSINFWDYRYGHLINSPIYINKNYINEHFSLDDFFQSQLENGIYRITCCDNSYSAYLISKNDNVCEGIILSPFCETYIEIDDDIKLCVSDDCFCHKLTEIEKFLYKISKKFFNVKQLSSSVFYKCSKISSTDKVYRMGYYDGTIDAYIENKNNTNYYDNLREENYNLRKELKEVYDKLYKYENSSK